MPAYSGRFRDGAAEGACEVSFDNETCTITPSAGPPLAFDLGDVDSVVPGDYDLTLTLYTGRRIVLHHFGKVLDRLALELGDSWRGRTVKCLLLNDLSEMGHFNGVTGTPPVPAEIRIFKSNLAVLPREGTLFQWRLADVDSFSFDAATYNVTIESGGRRLVVGKLAKKAEDSQQKLRSTLDALRKRSAAALRAAFPFLDAGALERLLRVMPEGRGARLSDLALIDRRLPEALAARASDEELAPYLEALRARTAKDAVVAGFKFVTEGDDDEGPEEAEAAIVFWFFFPLAGRNAVAWEAGTGSGRATYFFRHEDIADLTRGLALINFRREPIYVADAALAQQARLYRYAVGVRRLPELRRLRAAFLGRAIHSSVEAWTAQVDAVLS